MLGRRDEARARSAVYRLISRAFLWEPGVPYLEALADDTSVRILAKFGGAWIAQLPKLDLDALARELATEYARLFLGPGFHAHPYESIYASTSAGVRWTGENLLYGEVAADVEAFYREAEIAPGPSFRGLPDHVGVELECMSLLTAREARNWEFGDHTAAASSLRLQRSFLGQHLVPWLPRFNRRVRKFEAHPFYCTMATTASRFVRVDMQTVDELLGKCSDRDEETGEPNEIAAGMHSRRRR